MPWIGLIEIVLPIAQIYPKRHNIPLDEGFFSVLI